MKSRKNIIIAAAIVLLGTSFNPGYAETNSLIQMDVKRSSVTDTVDVTFYTTLDSANSVATRKSSNRYVVLLPNTASTESVAPSFGAVKDLITDIDVKHVNDGMGGYTKVTFGTTKPITIKTHMAKAAPLSQAQKDARALIAKSNIQNTEPIPTANTTQAKPDVQAAKPAVQTVKPAVQAKAEPQKTAALPKVLNIDAAKAKVASIIASPAAKKTETSNPKSAEKTSKPAAEKPKKETPSVQTPAPGNAYVPKMKYDSNGRRIIDLEPRVNHNIVSSSAKTVPAENIIPEAAAVPEINDNPLPAAVETPVSESKSEGFPYWVLGVSGSVVLLGILYLIFDAARHSADKDKSRLESFCNISAQNHVKRRKREYYDIVNNEELNWQEKYKLYNEQGNPAKPQKHIASMSYVTDISGLKKPAILAEGQSEELTPEQLSEKEHNRIVNEKVKAKMLELEKTYSAPSAQKETIKVSSGNNTTLKSYNDIKLKSFSKPMSLKENQRTLITEEKNGSRNKSYQEGTFVKLKASKQNNTAQDKLGTSDLINTGKKYLPKEGVKMAKEKENYLVSSLDEYMSILDNEKPDLTEMSAIKMPTSEAMVRSGVSNPISASYSRIPQNIIKPEQRVDGLIVKSGYNIDANSGFYVVSIDGVSAIVGKIKENIFVLKKFDRVIDNPIQVRRDDGNVYIVKLGKYKCLVNVEHDKMGTLIEI